MTEQTRRFFLVSVKPVVDWSEMDWDDKADNVPGTYVTGFEVVGTACDEKGLEEHVLDHFHDQIGIACLEDFDIDVRPIGSLEEAPADARAFETETYHVDPVAGPPAR